MSEVNNNTYSIMNNPLLQDTTVIQAAIGNIQDTLETLGEYTPTEVNTFVDWSYDAGDIVTLVQDSTEYVMPIFQNYLNWNGAHDVTWQSSGNEERELPNVQERQSYGYGSSVAAVQEEVEEQRFDFETYVEQTDTYISLIATETDVQAAQTVGQSLFQITSGQISSVVAQTGVTSTLEVFDPDSAYGVGEQVAYYNGTAWGWYEFTSAHQAGDAWSASEVTQINSQQTTIEQNTSSISMIVEKTGVNSVGTGQSLYGMLTVEAGKISQIVTAVGDNGEVTAASIVTAINGQGQGAVTISADLITLDGTSIVATGQFETHALYAPEVDCTSFYQSGSGGDFGVNAEAYFYNDVHMEGDVVFGYDGTGTLSGPTISVNTVNLGSYDLTATVLGGMIADASVNTSTNTLTLTKFDGTVINFSKAASGTVTVTDAWSGISGGGTYSVTVTQDGAQVAVKSTTPTIRFSGNQSSNFTVSIMSDGQTPAEQSKEYCYLVPLNGGISARHRVNVNAGANNDGSSAVGQLPLYLKVGTDTVYISKADTVPSGTSDSNVVAYKTYSPASGVTVTSITGSPLDSSLERLISSITATASNDATHSETLTLSNTTYGSGDHCVNLSLSGAGVIGRISTESVYTAGQNSVDVEKGTWSNGEITFAPSVGTGSSDGVDLSVIAEFGSGYTVVRAYDGNANTGESTTLYLKLGGAYAYITKVDSTPSGINDPNVVAYVPNSAGNQRSVSTLSGVSVGRKGNIKCVTTVTYTDGNTEDKDIYVDTTNVYNLGWADAEDLVKLPVLSTSNDTLTFEYPPNNVSSTPQTFTLTLTGVAYAQGAENTGRIVALDSNNNWRGRRSFTLSRDPSPSYNGYAYAKIGSTTLARLNIGDWYTQGWIDAIATIRLDPSTNETISSARTVYAKAYATPTATSRTNIKSVTLTPSGGGGGGNIVYRVPVGATVESAFYPQDYAYEWIAIEYRVDNTSYKGFMLSQYIRGTNAFNGSGTVNSGCQGGYTSIPSSMIFGFSAQVTASSGSTVNLRSSPNT